MTGASAFIRKACHEADGCHGMPSVLVQPKSTVRSTEPLRWRQWRAGATRHQRISCSPGRRPNSSRIGSGWVRAPPTPLSSWKRDCRCLAGSAARFCFNCRRAFEQIAPGFPISLPCSRLSGATLSNFATPAGTTTTSTRFWQSMTYRSACRTITTRHLLGSRQRATFTCAGMGQRAVTKAVIPPGRSAYGLMRSNRGAARKRRSTSISTMIRRALPPRTLHGCWICVRSRMDTRPPGAIKPA